MSNGNLKMYNFSYVLLKFVWSKGKQKALVRGFFGVVYIKINTKKLWVKK